MVRCAPLRELIPNLAIVLRRSSGVASPWNYRGVQVPSTVTEFAPSPARTALDRGDRSALFAAWLLLESLARTDASAPTPITLWDSFYKTR